MTIRNFPYQFPWYKKLGANIAYYVSKITLFPRKNLLSKEDILSFCRTISAGDIILCGNYREASAFFIPGAVTHTISYIWWGKCVHASAHGVSYISLKKVLRIYDSAVILRPFWCDDGQCKKYLDDIITKIGAPYDFYFWLGEREYFCSGLVNSSLLDTWYETGLHTIRPMENLFDELTDDFLRAHRALTPEKLVRGNFRIVFYSHNISYTDGTLWLEEE